MDDLKYYTLGLILGTALGYSVRKLVEPTQSISGYDLGVQIGKMQGRCETLIELAEKSEKKEES